MFCAIIEEILYQVYIWWLKLGEMWKVPIVKVTCIYVPAMYGTKFFKGEKFKGSPHFHEPQIFQQNMVSVCFPLNKGPSC
jgi:hypothetical protein